MQPGEKSIQKIINDLESENVILKSCNNSLKKYYECASKLIKNYEHKIKSFEKLQNYNSLNVRDQLLKFELPTLN